MSYGRDRDAVTRGVGAVASIDHANPSHSAARQRHIAQELAHKDVRRARFTYGVRGGIDAINGLGRVNLRNFGGAGTRSTNVMAADPTASSTGGGGAPRPGGGGLAPAGPTSPRAIYHPSIPKKYSSASSPVIPQGQGGRPMPKIPFVAPPRPPIKPPPRILTAGAPTTPVAGGGGGGGSPHSSGAGVVDAPHDDLPDLAPEPEAASSPSSNRNLFIALGVAAALYWYATNEDGDE